MSRGAVVAAGKRWAKSMIGAGIARRQPVRTDIPLGHWGLRVGTTGSVWLRDADLTAIATEHGTPLHVVDGERLDDACRDAVAAFATGSGAEIYYSYKTNPIPTVLRRLHSHGIGAEVISEYELWLALQLGVDGSKIIYNGPAKSDASIRTAIDVGAIVNANSLPEVHRIVAASREAGSISRLGVRVSLPGMWGGQFGMPGGSEVLSKAVRAALDAPDVELIAMHAHRGGTMRTEDEWRGHVTQVIDQCDALAHEFGWRPQIIDVGGSLACPSSAGIPHREFRLNRAFGTDLLPPDPASSISIRRASEIAHDLVARRLGPDARAVLEPGRALTADSQFLLVSVVDVRDDLEPPHLVLDGGRNLCDPLPHEYHQIVSVRQPESTASTPYRLVGPICTPADVLAYGWRLPEQQRGDVLAIMDAGAYFVPFSTAFSFPRPGVVLIDGDGTTVVRDHESFSDLIRLDH